MLNRFKQKWWMVVLFVALAALIFKGPVADLVSMIRSDPSKGYIYTVPLVFIYLSWLRKERFRLYQVQSSFFGPVMLVIALLAMVVGESMHFRFLFQMSIVFLFVAAALTFLGSRFVIAALPALSMSKARKLASSH